jgi:acyl-CoA oxidase
MEHGRMSSPRGKQISREVNDLCRKVRPLAVDLVNGFGVPEEMLRSEELIG